MNRLALMIGGALAALTSPLAAQTIAITNATVATGTGADAMTGATVVVRDGRIAAVGRGVAVPAGAEVVDGTGKWVTPGIVGGFTRLGIVEVDAVEETEDSEAANSPYSAAIDVAPAVNPRSVNIPINRIEGVTRAVVVPTVGKEVFAGQGAIIHLGEADDVVTKARAFQFVELGERGAGVAGGSRAAAFAELRDGLREARSIAAGKGDFGPASRDAVLNRADAEALVPVVQGRQPLLIHVERASDILRVLDLKREMPALKMILAGAGEGWTVADRIAAAGVPVIAYALNNLPGDFETTAATQSNVGRLVKAGVKVGLGMQNDNDARQIRLLTQHAGNLVALTKVPGATGLTQAQALASITSANAEIFGLTDVGSLAPGKRADVVVWDGDPLELQSAPTMVLIDGKPQSMVSRQTKLRDRYNPTRKHNLPEAYSR